MHCCALREILSRVPHSSCGCASEGRMRNMGGQSSRMGKKAHVSGREVAQTGRATKSRNVRWCFLVDGIVDRDVRAAAVSIACQASQVKTERASKQGSRKAEPYEPSAQACIGLRLVARRQAALTYK